MRKILLFFTAVIAVITASPLQAQIFIADSAKYRFAVPPDEVDLSYSPMGPASLDSAAMSRLGEGDPDYRSIGMYGLSRLYSLEQSGKSWQEADLALRDLLTAFAGNPYVNSLRQEAASVMLWNFLLSDTVTAARQEAVGRYTAMMVDSRHPDADLLERALQYLSIHDAWSLERRSEAAAQGAQAARTFLAKNDASLLERVGLGDMPGAAELNTVVKKRHARVARAMLRLEQMAKTNN